MQVYTASHVVPVSARPFLDGAIAVDGGRIVAVGARDEVLERVGADAAVCEVGRAALIPGLVNAHVHVELSWLAEDPPEAGDFVRWMRELLERRTDEDPDRVAEAASKAVDAMVARGTAAIGDVANGTSVGPVLARSPLYGVMFHEIVSPRAADAETAVAAATRRLEILAANPDVAAGSARWRLVLTPHAPHTTSEPLLRALAGRSTAAGEPLSIHLAESVAEVEFLRSGGGAFADLLLERGSRDESFVPPRLSPVEYLDRIGALGPRTIAVHCVQLGRTDHSRLQSKGASVVTCPRSNARLGVGRAPVRELMREGVPVALGTDSLASSPDLDLFAEMAALRQTHADLAPAAIVRMATLNGARVLGLESRLGSLEPGKLARVVVVPLAASQDDPIAALCDRPSEVRWLEPPTILPVP